MKKGRRYTWTDVAVACAEENDYMNFPDEIKDLRRLEEVIIRPVVIPGSIRNPQTVAKHLLE
jgi:hypothetical protein